MKLYSLKSFPQSCSTLAVQRATFQGFAPLSPQPQLKFAKSF